MLDKRSLAREAIDIMTTSLNGTGYIRLVEICKDLGLDHKQPVNKLAEEIKKLAEYK